MATVRLAVMQPYFFPYVGYFDLVARVDLFVMLTDVQFQRQGWINRNRIRAGERDDWCYVTVPVAKAPLATPIHDIVIADRPEWRRRLRGLLRAGYGDAGMQSTVGEPLLEPLDAGHVQLVDLLDATLQASFEVLDIDTPVVDSRTITIDPTAGGVDRVLALCEAVGATTYVNLPGGHALYDPADFEARGIELELVEPVDYADADGTANTLSVLDPLLRGDRDRVVRWLRDRAPR